MSGITAHGIRYPDGASKAKNLGPELKQMAEDTDNLIHTELDAANPVFQAKAEAAATVAVATEIAESPILLRTETGAVRTLVVTDALLAEAVLSYDYRIIGGMLRTGGEVGNIPGYTDILLPSGNGLATVTRDYRRADPGAGLDGAFPESVIEQLAARSLKFVSLTNWSDSMGRDNGGLGTSVIAEVASMLDVTGYDRGFSGDTPQQVAARIGAFAPRVMIPDNTLPATGTVAVTVSPPSGWRGTRTWDGTMPNINGQIIPVRLVQDSTDQDGVPTWTLAQRGSGQTAQTVLSGTRFKHADATDEKALAAPAMIWVGRNDLNLERGRAALTAMLAELRDPAQRYIVLSVWNRTNEPAGSPGYDSVMAYNNMLEDVAGSRFFDGRAEFIRHGLAIAGIAPTPSDVTALSEDRPPTSLLADTTHPNVAGRQAFGRLLANEIIGRNW